MEQTVSTIVRHSSQPLSIVIVGVGNANFASMNRLDGDDGRLKDSSGRFASEFVAVDLMMSLLEIIAYSFGVMVLCLSA